jgi:hypothetical protein
MARLAENRSALHIVWVFPSPDAASVKALQDRLADGHESRLFNLQMFGFRDGKASATLTPAAPLEDILELIWGADQRPASISVVRRPQASAARKRTTVRRERKDNSVLVAQPVRGKMDTRR